MSAAELLFSLCTKARACSSCGGRVSFWNCVPDPLSKPVRLLCPTCKAEVT